MKTIYFSVVYFIVIIIVAHFFVPPEYVWTQNTVSDLAAQGLPNQWIMQAGFIGFGVLLNLGFLQKSIATRKIGYPDIPVMVYGLAILVTGLFSTMPFIAGAGYSEQESNLHSLFAQIAGVFFIIGILYRLIIAPTAKERSFHTAFFLLVMGTSLAFGLSENGMITLGKGVIQRTLYLVSFVWLILSQWRYARSTTRSETDVHYPGTLP